MPSTLVQLTVFHTGVASLNLSTKLVPPMLMSVDFMRLLPFDLGVGETFAAMLRPGVTDLSGLKTCMTALFSTLFVAYGVSAPKCFAPK